MENKKKGKNPLSNPLEDSHPAKEAVKPAALPDPGLGKAGRQGGGVLLAVKPGSGRAARPTATEKQIAEQAAQNRRENLRVPVNFDSFVYPVTGRWTGRCEVTVVNLSCTGVSFTSVRPLAIGEVVEIVLAVTKQPLIQKCKILRAVMGEDEKTGTYSAKFVDQLESETVMIRETVFCIQIRNRKKEIKKGAGKNGEKA